MVWLFLAWNGTTSWANDTAWRYHLADLHQAITARQWYAAKRALASLKRQNPHDYQAKEFQLTEAWVARQEARWGSVLRIHERARPKASWSLLEKVRSLAHMGRHTEAVSLATPRGVRFTSREQWELQGLLASCYRALGRPEDAIAAYRQLTRRKVPSKFRIPAYQALMELYYQAGNAKRARAIAESLQNKYPASDAALYAVDLQEARETPAYLNRLGTWKRFAGVCYRNRDYDRSDRYFGKIVLAGKRGKEVDRARYFMLRTLTKREQSERAIAAMERELPVLQDSSFEGPASFQYARALFMEGRDQRVIDFVTRYWRADPKGKWPRECVRLWILSLRREGDYLAFRELEHAFKRHGAPAWLRRFYHRNGLMWAMGERRTRHAQYHLQAYRATGLKTKDRQEALLWEGIIQWDMGQELRAIQAWLKILERDPNHFFGLTAREYLRNGVLASDRTVEDFLDERLQSLSLDQLKELFFLAPDTPAQALVADRLKRVLPAWTLRPQLPDPASEAAKMAEIGRFDLAAQALTQKGIDSSTYHFLKAKWHLMSHNLHDSIYHADILVKSLPRWIPHELLPEEVQQLVYPQGYAEIVHDKAASFQVDPYLLLAIIREESHFDAEAKSWASARGLMQFIPSTAREIASEIEELGPFSLAMLYDPQTSITLGARYIDKLMDAFDGDSLYTVAAYNAGESAVQRWRDLSEFPDPVLFVGDVTYEETKNYCQKVLRAYHHYTRVYQKERTPRVIAAPSLRAPGIRAPGIRAPGIRAPGSP